MNPPRFDEYDYINFLIAAQKAFSRVEAARVQPEKENSPSHDSINRLLHRLKPESASLWEEAKHHIYPEKGFLVIDDSTLDKLYARKIELVTRHWSGKHHGVVQGINLVTLLWTDGDVHIPCDARVYYKQQGGKTKNNHFQDMLFKAKSRGLSLECVLFDSWYASLKNLKTIRSLGWKWLARFHSNRLVNPDGKGNIPLSEASALENGTKVHLKGYGFVLVFWIVSKNGDAEYWVTNDLDMDFFQRLKLSSYSWNIEHYHRGLKQFRGIEKSMVRSAIGQRNHILLSIRAFPRLEVFSIKTGRSWFEEKTQITERLSELIWKSQFMFYKLNCLTPNYLILFILFIIRDSRPSLFSFFESTLSFFESTPIANLSSLKIIDNVSAMILQTFCTVNILSASSFETLFPVSLIALIRDCAFALEIVRNVPISAICFRV